MCSWPSPLCGPKFLEIYGHRIEETKERHGTGEEDGEGRRSGKWRIGKTRKKQNQTYTKYCRRMLDWNDGWPNHSIKGLRFRGSFLRLTESNSKTRSGMSTYRSNALLTETQFADKEPTECIMSRINKSYSGGRLSKWISSDTYSVQLYL